MDIKVFYSSSRGNLYQVDDLLIDPGITIVQMKPVLSFKLHKITACLISHSHMDHARGTKELMRNGIDCYMTQDTAADLGIAGHRVHVIEAGKQFRIGSWQILPFSLIHDVSCVGFLMASRQEKLLFSVDTQYVPIRVKGLTHIMIEVNYDMSILTSNIWKGNVSGEVAKNVIRNHMSLETAKEFFRVNDMRQVQEIHLLHLSDGNSDAEMFKSEIQKITGRPVYIGGRKWHITE